MRPIVDSIRFNYDNYVFVADSQNTSKWKFNASIRDGIGLGSGDTPNEAVKSLIRNLRKTADDIEKLRKLKWG